MIAIGADHGGVELKDDLVAWLRARGEEVDDVGTRGDASVDYPDYGRAVAERVARGLAESGVLLCTNGIGMAIVANKFPDVRAALVGDATAARMAREHNDANVLVLGGGMIGKFHGRELLFRRKFLQRVRQCRSTSVDRNRRFIQICTKIRMQMKRRFDRVQVRNAFCDDTLRLRGLHESPGNIFDVSR